MRKVETYVYNYDELNGEARERAYNAVIDGIIDDRCWMFNKDVKMAVAETFPNSDLHVQYDLSCSQGSGLNLYGTFNLLDFFNDWNCSDAKLKRTIKFYIDTLMSVGYASSLDIELSENYRNAYSMTFRDKEYADVDADEIADDLKYNGIANVNVKAIEAFIVDMFNHVEKIERDWYEDGCNFLDLTNGQVDEYCRENGIEFDCRGRIAM